MKIALSIVAILLSLHPASAQAQTNCPWLNAATAGGALGGEVIMHVTTPTAGDVTCEFIRTNNPAARLTIVVHTMKTPSQDFAGILSQCTGKTVPLRAIGNEAFQCLTKSSSSANEIVIGRIRERAFTLTVNAAVGEPADASAALSESTRNLAEQIAGSLF